MDRPRIDSYHGTYVTTPRTVVMMQLLGIGIRSGSVTLTKDETAAIRKLYDFKLEGPNEKPPPPTAPKQGDFKDRWSFEEAVRKHQEALKAHDKWEDPRPILQAGADRNVIRHAEADGLRLLAWIARYVPPGEDPLKYLVRAFVDAGWDVDPSDIEWAEQESEEEDDDVEEAS